MPKCIITFEDIEDGQISAKVAFDPLLDNPLHGHKASPAQALGWDIAQALSAHLSNAVTETKVNGELVNDDDLTNGES